MFIDMARCSCHITEGKRVITAKGQKKSLCSVYVCVFVCLCVRVCVCTEIKQ